MAFALPRPGEAGPSPWLDWLDRPGRALQAARRDGRSRGARAGGAVVAMAV